MAGVAFVDAEVSGAAAALGRLAEADLHELMYKVGQAIETQTKLRIADEKTAPDGARWVPWYEAYDNDRNHKKHSLLVSEGHLLDSITNYTTGTEAVVGSNLGYARVHQFGSDPSRRAPGVPDGAAGAGIPARPYLGLSADNRAAIEALVTGRIEDLLR